MKREHKKPLFRPAKDDTKPLLQDPVRSPLSLSLLFVCVCVCNIKYGFVDFEVGPDCDGGSCAPVTSFTRLHQSQIPTTTEFVDIRMPFSTLY